MELRALLNSAAPKAALATLLTLVPYADATGVPPFVLALVAGGGPDQKETEQWEDAVAKLAQTQAQMKLLRTELASANASWTAALKAQRLAEDEAKRSRQEARDLLHEKDGAVDAKTRADERVAQLEAAAEARAREAAAGQQRAEELHAKLAKLTQESELVAGKLTARVEEVAALTGERRQLQAKLAAAELDATRAQEQCARLDGEASQRLEALGLRLGVLQRGGELHATLHARARHLEIADAAAGEREVGAREALALLRRRADREPQRLLVRLRRVGVFAQFGVGEADVDERDKLAGGVGDLGVEARVSVL